MKPRDIACEVYGGPLANAKNDNTAPKVQSLMVSFDRPGRVVIAVDDGRLLVHVYEGARPDSTQPAKGAFGCNDGENGSWLWHEGADGLESVHSAFPAQATVS